jgi:hypothetical protein
MLPAREDEKATAGNRQVGAVATEDRTTDKGRREPREDTNVVPFPGDWIGPRDELVPVATGPAGSVSGEDVVPPLAPDAFWSEHSDAVHDVLKAPAPQPELPVRGRRPRVPYREALASMVAWMPRPGVPSSRPHLPPLRLPALRLPTVCRPAVRLRLVVVFWSAVAVTAVAVVCVPALVSSLAGRSRPHPSAIARAGSRDSGGLARAAGLMAVTRSPRPHAGVGPAVGQRSHRAGVRARARRAHARRSPTVTSGIMVSDRTSRSSAGAGQTGSAPLPPVYSGGGHAAVGGSNAGGGSRPSPPAPGPVGQGAPFGPGQMG